MAAGWGDLTWGFNNWGDQGSVSVEITGIALKAAIGNEDTQANANVDVTGIRNNLSINSVSLNITADVPVTGTQLKIQTGNTIISIPVTVEVTTAGRLNITPGNVSVSAEVTEGWGVYQWGIVPWGGGQAATVSVTGSALTIQTHPVDIKIDGNIFVSVDEDDDIIVYLNSVTPKTDVAFAVTTAGRLNVSIGEEVVVTNVSISVTGSQLNANVGQVVGGTITPVDVTGSQLNVSIGNTSQFGNATVSVTGSRLNVAPGQITYAAGYNVTGSRLNISEGSVSFVISGNVSVTGLRLNITQGSARVQTWTQVQTDAHNVWTPVDLAA